jgi:hypothetical protein
MMWVPGAITYSIVFIVFLFRWLAEEDGRSTVPLVPAKGGRTIGG